MQELTIYIHRRVIADYELNFTITKQTADLMLRKAENIISKYPTIDKAAFKAGVENINLP